MPSRSLRAYQTGSAVVRTLPGPVAGVLGRVAGTVVATFAGDRRRQVERNLRRVYGPSYGGAALRRSVVETFVSYANYYVESFRLPGTSAATLDEGFTCEGCERLVEAREAGRGAIVALPHLGSWEWAGFWLVSVLEMPITVVVEPLEPPDVYDWFKDLRESFGMHVVALGHDAGGAVLRALRDNHIVCLPSDRDLGGGGIEVEFFGERTTLPAGPATMALRTGAPLFPTAIFTTSEGRQGVIRPALDTSRQGKLREDVQRVTQDLAGELEALIRRAPEQWHLLQPNWPSDRAPSAGSPEPDQTGLP